MTGRLSNVSIFLVLLLLVGSEAFSFSGGLPRTKKARGSLVLQFQPRPAQIGWQSSKSMLRMDNSIITSDGMNEIRQNETSEILQAATVVGAVTAAVGFLYIKALGLSQKTIWKVFPSFLAQQGVAINPLWFMTGTCTLGGLIVGVLSSKLKLSYGAGNFVAAFSAVPAETKKLPKSRTSLMPLLCLCLLTSAFGFSLGPEAPMVGAGGLVGASLGRRMFGSDETKKVEALAYAGAAGCLTASMGIPIAGSIFALEMTRSSAGLSTGAREAFSPAIAASVAGLVLLRLILLPNESAAGHFFYGAVGAITGKAMMLTALACGLGGALLGTLFHKTYAALSGLLWRTSKKEDANSWKRNVFIKTAIGLFVGLLSTLYPQTLFWGEGSLQCAIDGFRTPFTATKHGLSSALTSAALVDPSVPYRSAGAAVQVGIAKLTAIAVACAGRFPGGIIFPLFSAAPAFAHAFASILAPGILPVAVMCLMSATQASVTRTPLASTLILGLLASPTTELSVILPACLVSSYLSVWVAQILSKNSYFQYSK